MSVKEDIRKPINILFLSIAILSIILSTIFYYNSKKDKVPKYLISENHSLIFNSKESSPSLRVFDRDSALISENIYIFSCTFWNAGDLPIEPGDVRIPVELMISPCLKILDFKITDETNPHISNFSLINNNMVTDSTSSITLRWDHLDPNYGVKFQVMYTSNKVADVYFKGVISGVKSILDARTLIQKYSWLTYLRDIFDFLIIYAVIVVSALLTRSLSAAVIERFKVSNNYLKLIVRSPIFIIIFYGLFYMAYFIHEFVYSGDKLPF